MAYLVYASPTTVLHVRFCKFYTLLPMTMSQRVLLLGRLTAIVTGHDDKMFDHYLVYIHMFHMSTSAYLLEYVPFFLKCKCYLFFYYTATDSFGF